MTSARRPNIQPLPFPHSMIAGGEHGQESTWPMALRSLLLLTEAVHPADPYLARLSDDDLTLLRASLARLSAGESTSAA